MRILAGKYKSKKIETINSPFTRPMMSKVREAIFSSLQNNIQDSYVLDLYAGSGSLGIEAMSRGAGFVTFVENSKDCEKVINKNLKDLDNNYKVSTLSVQTFIDSSVNKYDLIFYDPPFKLQSEIVDEEVNVLSNILEKDGYLITHRHSSENSIKFNEIFHIHKEKKYGQSKIVIVRKL